MPIILESYCMYKDMSRKKCQNYISRTKRPKWCLFKNKKRIPQYKCLKSSCPFFAYTDASEKDYRLFDKVYKKEVGK